jgi:hypothetical protein
MTSFDVHLMTKVTILCSLASWIVSHSGFLTFGCVTDPHLIFKLYVNVSNGVATNMTTLLGIFCLEIFAILDVTQHRLVVTYRRFRTTYWSHL